MCKPTQCIFRLAAVLRAIVITLLPNSRYARLYKQVARDINDLKGRKINYTAITGKRNKDGSDIYKNAVYYCRGDQKGQQLDRAAMIAASQSLGHNRESVVGEHYIHI